MPEADVQVEVYLEVGAKRVVAGALAWPGWCRSGRDEDAALAALAAAGPRYARAVDAVGLTPPPQPATFVVVERLPGNATTDYGVPDAAAPGDDLPLDGAELARLQTLLRAGWGALDEAARAAAGKSLRLGPRGGGRDRDAILNHVLEAERSYLQRLGTKASPQSDEALAEAIARTRQLILDTLATVAREGTPPPGPRGGKRWSARYFVRRSAWHALDHAWEIEDRAEAPA